MSRIAPSKPPGASAFAAARPGCVGVLHVGALPDPERPDLRRASATSTPRSAAPRRIPAGSARLPACRWRCSGVCSSPSCLALIALCSRSATTPREPCRAMCSRRRRSGLAAVLYLAYASFLILGGVPALRGHLRRRHRAVPDFGSGDQVSHDQSSQSRVRDLALCSHAGGAGGGGCLRGGRGRRDRGVSRAARHGRGARAGHGRRQRAGTRRAPPAVTAAQIAAVRGVPRGSSRACRDGAQRRRRGGDRQVQRLPVPAVPADLSWTTSRCLRSGPSSSPAK